MNANVNETNEQSNEDEYVERVKKLMGPHVVFMYLSFHDLITDIAQDESGKKWESLFKGAREVLANENYAGSCMFHQETMNFLTLTKLIIEKQATSEFFQKIIDIIDSEQKSAIHAEGNAISKQLTEMKNLLMYTSWSFKI